MHRSQESSNPLILNLSLQVPFELQQLLNCIHGKLEFGQMQTKRFLEYLNIVVDKALALTTEKEDALPMSSKSLIHDSNTLLKIFNFHAEDDLREDAWMNHPVFFKLDWLRQYLEKYGELEKLEPLINPTIFKKCTETLLELIKTQIKGEPCQAEVDKQVLLKLKTLFNKGRGTVKFAETSFKLIPKLFASYTKKYFELLTRLKSEIEQYDEHRCKEIRQSSEEQTKKNVEMFQKQKVPCPDVVNTIAAIQTASSEVKNTVDTDTIIYGNPRVFFKGRESSTEYQHLIPKNQRLFIDEENQAFAAEIKLLSEEIQSASPNSRSLMFANKNKLAKALGTRILLPKKASDSILLLPPGLVLDPVFIELDDKRYAEIVMYYECVNNIFNVEVFLKYDQERQFKIYHFLKELPCAPDAYAPIFSMWFNGRVSKPEDTVKLTYSCKSLVKNLKGGITRIQLTAGTYADFTAFEGRYIPSAAYSPLRLNFFDGLKIKPILNFELVKQQAQDVLKARTRKEWEKFCKSLGFKLNASMEDPSSLFQLFHSLEVLYTTIECILYFCFGKLFEKHEIFKCFRDAGIHKNKGDFIKFLTSTGQDGAHLMQLEKLATELLQGANRIQRMQLKPDVPFLSPILEVLNDDCVGAYEVRLGKTEKKQGLEIQPRVNGDSQDVLNSSVQNALQSDALKGNTLQGAALQSDLHTLKSQLSALQSQFAAFREEQAKFQEESRATMDKILTDKLIISTPDLAEATVKAFGNLGVSPVEESSVPNPSGMTTSGGGMNGVGGLTGNPSGGNGNGLTSPTSQASPTRGSPMKNAAIKAQVS